MKSSLSNKRTQPTRRTAFTTLGGAVIAASPVFAKRKPRVLVRSGWQTVNIGDIAHTPGMLQLLSTHMPDAEIFLWPAMKLDRGADQMIARHFPKVRVVESNLDANGQPGTADLKQCFEQCDLLLHSSGPSLVASKQMEAWSKVTSKPYGFFGVGFTLGADQPVSPAQRNLIDGSRFIFTRETASLQNLKKIEAKSGTLGFAPDSTFAMNIRDDQRGFAYLAQNKLENKKFVAVIPRLRYTPYHLIRPVNFSPDEIKRRDAFNQQHAETDHAKLREAIIAWVRQTKNRVLLCPEMTYEIDIIDPLLFDPLPEDVKPHIVRRKEWWLPDEAASIYSRAAAVISFECHSPIMAAGQGTPCMYIHQKEDGIKGQMWPDIGLSSWYFEADTATGAEISQRLLDLCANYDKSLKTIRTALQFARQKEAAAMKTVRQSV